MELNTLGELLESVFPTAYWSFPEKKAPPMPYLIYFEEASDNFAADNKVYHHRKQIAVELMTAVKDPSAESAVEAVFDANDIFWNKTETHLDDENAYEVIYTLEV